MGLYGRLVHRLIEEEYHKRKAKENDKHISDPDDAKPWAEQARMAEYRGFFDAAVIGDPNVKTIIGYIHLGREFKTLDKFLKKYEKGYAMVTSKEFAEDKINYCLKVLSEELSEKG